MLLLQPQNGSLLVWLSSAVIWLIVLMILSGDVLGSSRHLVSKTFWLLVLWGLPMVGGAFYALASLFVADWSSVKGLFRGSKGKPKTRIIGRRESRTLKV